MATSAKLVLKVFFVDKSFKTLAISPTVTAKDLIDVVADKVGLEDTKGFNVFMSKKGEERCLDDSELPCSIMVWETHGLDADVRDYTNKEDWDRVKKSWEEKAQFIFKRRLFLKNKPLPSDKTNLINYTYIQAVADVIGGDYMCTKEDALTLAGLQMQVVFGNFKATVHTKGFLSQERIPEFIPNHMLSQHTYDEWESMIFQQHQKLESVTKLDAQLQYLDYVRKWFFYGSMFWKVKVLNEKDANLPEQVILAVNSDGIHLLKVGTRELISTHTFSDVYSWAYKQTAFAFVSGSLSKKKFQFETSYGKDIAKTLQSYVDILMEEYRNATAAASQ